MITRSCRRLGAALLLAAAILTRAEPAGAVDVPDLAPYLQPVEAAALARSEDQTFLAFPEWFLVHSPAEYAEYVKSNTPAAFPFWGHIKQLWTSYGAVIDATKAYPFNAEYHVMINVIGVSTTVEYALRSAYESLIGRVTELTRDHGPTDEETYGAFVAQDYVDFIRVRPWYEYDFTQRLVGLWRETRWFGPDLLRKWERRYVLTTEYAIKAVYAKLIGLGTQASYGAELPTTSVVIDRLPEYRDALPELKLQVALPDGSWRATVPRYEAFKHYATQLANAGIGFREIAGNGPQAPILLSVLAPSHWRPAPPAITLFEQPILTQPDRKRVALVVTVGRLSPTLRGLDEDAPVVLEHIYDY